MTELHFSSKTHPYVSFSRRNQPQKYLRCCQKMGCKVNYCNPPIPCKFPSRKPSFRSTTIAFSSTAQNKQETVPGSTTKAAIESQELKTASCSVSFKTLGACKLGISRYPDFEYNAEGGTGTGTGTTIIVGDSDNETSVCFDIKTLYIPPLTSATTKFLGLALPPLLKIDIVPELFNGSINQESGKVELEFTANFWFSIGSIYRAPPLLVKTVLTSEESKGKIRRGRGERLNKEGKCRLVGVATVDPIDDFLMNSFLSLPTECLANLNAVISFSNSS